MKTTIISFSARPNGNCAQIGKLIRSLTPDAVLFDFSEFALRGCGGCDYACFAERERCPYIGDMECEMLEAVTRSESACFIIPNYCDYPCANFFIFNERSQCYFQGRPEKLDAYLRVPKRGVVVSNTNEENFRKALSYHCGKEPDILFLSARKYGKVSIRGDLLTDGRVMEEIRRFVENPAQPL